MKKIIPTKERVLVKRLEQETLSAGGIYIPDSATEKPSEGEIMAIGPGVTHKVGENVLFAKYAGTEIELNGETHLILSVTEILGVYND